MRRREALVEGLDAQARREECLERVVAEEQLAGTEAAGVRHYHQRARRELDAHARVRGLVLRVPQQRSRHSQVLREVCVALELPQQVLPAPAQAQYAAALERFGELPRRKRTRPARIEDLDPPHAPAGDQRRELGANRLDLG